MILLRLTLMMLAWLAACVVLGLLVALILGTFMRVEHAEGIASWFGFVLFMMGVFVEGLE